MTDGSAPQTSPGPDPGRSPRWIPRRVIESAHLDQLREHGGLPGIRDENALESALARPRNRWLYEPESDVAALTAAYAFGLARNHGFNDGNKRIALLAAVTFLVMNGFDLDATEPEAVRIMLALAAGELPEDELANWLRGRIVPLSR